MTLLPFNPETTLISITMIDLSATETAFLEKDGRIDMLTKEAQTLTYNYNQAVSERNTETGRADALKLDLDKKQAELDAANLALAQSKALAIRLQAEIALLKGATTPTPTIPPPIPPPTTPQKITRTVLGRWAGFTIEKSMNAPSQAMYNDVRTAMAWGQRMGFTVWRGFFNPSEVLEHQKATPMYGHLPQQGRAMGLRFIADTIDTILAIIGNDLLDPKDLALKTYMDGLAKMGAEGVYFNDADDRPIAALKADAIRLRKVAPDMPIFVSLMGSANLDAYKTLADDEGNLLIDWEEIQTFGSAAELETFLKKDAIMCLDLRTPMTATTLKTRTTLLLQNPPKAFFYYADLAPDYEAASDSEDAVIRDFLVAWKKLAV